MDGIFRSNENNRQKNIIITSMVVLYQIGIFAYTFIIYLASPFNNKAKQWLHGRKNIFQHIKQTINPETKKVWFHVSSLGEFEQGRPVIEAYKAKYPNIEIVLTFFSPSGYEVRKNYEGADYVFYLPIDSRNNARKFIALVKPTQAFFVKYEFWHHYLSQLKKNHIPTYIVSAIFRPQQLFFKPYGRWYLAMLKKFTYLYVQNQESLDLLNTHGINNCSIGGDTRFDRVYDIAQKAKQLPIAEAFSKGAFVIVAGSTWPKDEELLFEFIKHLPANGKLLIAPHEVHSKNIERIIQEAPEPILKYSEANQQKASEAKLLLIDSIGILSSLYQYGQLAYIGNGFGPGIHNTLEAATFGLPVVFGPNYHRFQEACDLIESKAGFTINSYEKLHETFNQLINDENLRISSGKAASKYVKSMCGGTVKIMAKIAES